MLRVYGLERCGFGGACGRAIEGKTVAHTDEPPAKQRAMSEAGDRLGQLFERAGNHWALGEDVPREVWREIGETASLIAAYAAILAGAGAEN